MIHILLIVIGIVLIVVNRDIKNERADDGGSFANILKNEEKEFTDYDMKFVDMRKDMAESILDLQKEIQELRTEVFNIENSNVNIKENIKQVKLDNDIKRDCIDKDIISEINFNNLNLKDNHCDDSKFENIKMMIDEGKVLRINEEMFTMKHLMDEAKEKIQNHLKEENLITIAQVRDMFSTSRKSAKPILEYMDSIKVTKKTGGESERVAYL